MKKKTDKILSTKTKTSSCSLDQSLALFF